MLVRVSALRRAAVPDTVGLSAQSLGLRPENYHVYWGGERWIEMNRYRNPWPYCAGVASALRFECDTEQSGVA